MHAEPAPEPTQIAAPPPPVELPTAGEWTIGVVFVLAALSLVAWIGWTLWAL